MSRLWSRRRAPAEIAALASAALVLGASACAGGGGQSASATAGETSDSDSDGADAFYDLEPGPLCGAAAPIRLLALAEDEALIEGGGPTRIGAHYYVTTARAGEGPGTSTTTRVGLCGEAPRVVADGVEGRVFALPPWPSAPVACRGGALVALDGAGEGATMTLIAGVCGLFSGFQPVDVGVVGSFLVSDSDVLGHDFYPYIEGDAPGVGEGVEVVPSARSEAVRGAEIVFFADAGEYGLDADALLRVDLTTLEQTILVEATGERFAASDDHLLYEGAGGIVLRDRADASEALVHGPLLSSGDYSEDVSLESGFAVIRDASGVRIVDVASGAVRDVAPDVEIVQEVGGGRWLVVDAEGQAALLEHASGATSAIGEVVGSIAFVGSDELWVERGLSGWTYEREVAALPYTGVGEVPLAARASPGFRRLSDGRVVTLVNVDDDGRGDLVVVDRATLHERWIDGSVRSFRVPDAASDPGVVAYHVADGERSGVYVVNLLD
ncbi:MAG: hypothetical protein R3A79_31255 [Nannocystaceae bacterium]